MGEESQEKEKKWKDLPKGSRLELGELERHWLADLHGKVGGEALEKYERKLSEYRRQGYRTPLPKRLDKRLRDMLFQCADHKLNVDSEALGRYRSQIDKYQQQGYLIGDLYLHFGDLLSSRSKKDPKYVARRENKGERRE